jgi:hypothetical protein
MFSPQLGHERAIPRPSRLDTTAPPNSKLVSISGVKLIGIWLNETDPQLTSNYDWRILTIDYYATLQDAGTNNLLLRLHRVDISKAGNYHEIRSRMIKNTSSTSLISKNSHL